MAAHTGRHAKMAHDILHSSFPLMDVTVSDYINAILEGGIDDFGTTAELYEAIGGMLEGLDNEKSQEDAEDVCRQLFNLMINSADQNANNGPMKILNAPINLGALAENMVENTDEQAAVWMINKRHNSSQVDLKKLEKAEAKIRQKQEKRAQQDAPTRKIEEPESATASQQSNRRDAKMNAAGTNKTNDIRIENFDVSYGEKTLLKGADMMLVYGRRYGLVGRNGIGKTTLLRMLAKRQLQMPSHLSVLHVEQEVVGDETGATQSVLECDEVREGLLAEERSINAQLSGGTSTEADGALSSRLAAVYLELEAIESDKAPARTAIILVGLGFTPQMQRMKTKEFSGGWRMRLALARALFTIPDLLLLDEPTNMLDMKAIIWLENYLQTWPTTLLVVSHDRMFLNSVTTDILHTHTQRIDAYHGDYEAFVKSRTDRLRNQQREYESQQQFREHIQIFIDRFRYNANRASQVQSKLKILEKLPEVKPVEKESVVQFSFPECDKLGGAVLQMDELCFHFTAEKPIFTNVTISACMDSRICIVGENGAGKTTLLRLLLGNLEPVSGVHHVHRGLRIGYFSQHHVDQLDMNLTSIEVLAARLSGKSSEYYRQRLGAFGVSGDLATRPVTSLSGGQKSRVAFAQMALTTPNFFILDEPTNHLDMETIEALAHALNKFVGGVILVSHDERLIKAICTELWVCQNRTVRSLEGGIDEYKKLVEAEMEAQN